MPKRAPKPALDSPADDCCNVRAIAKAEELGDMDSFRRLLRERWLHWFTDFNSGRHFVSHLEAVFGVEHVTFTPGWWDRHRGRWVVDRDEQPARDTIVEPVTADLF